jgi:hypothetical protein
MCGGVRRIRSSGEVHVAVRAKASGRGREREEGDGEERSIGGEEGGGGGERRGGLWKIARCFATMSIE